MDIAHVMQAAATIVAAKIADRAARGVSAMTDAEITMELARSRDAVWASLKVPPQS